MPEQRRPEIQSRVTPTFKRLADVDWADIIALMSHPLTGDTFGEAECEAFLAAREGRWAEHGYGPWAFVVDGGPEGPAGVGSSAAPSARWGSSR